MLHELIFAWGVFPLPTLAFPNGSRDFCLSYGERPLSLGDHHVHSWHDLGALLGAA